VEIDHGESRYDETPPEEDRKEEEERPHAPAPQRETLRKQTRKGGRSKSERASSFKRVIFLNGFRGRGIQFVCSVLPGIRKGSFQSHSQDLVALLE
jgi:hypothetical protein